MDCKRCNGAVCTNAGGGVESSRYEAVWLPTGVVEDGKEVDGYDILICIYLS